MQSDACPCSICERNIEFSIAFLLPSISETLSLAMASSSSTGNLLPYFDFDVQRNVTVTVGQIAFFHCRVERLGDKDVSIVLHSKHFSYFIRWRTWFYVLDSIAFIIHKLPRYYAILIRPNQFSQ